MSDRETPDSTPNLNETLAESAAKLGEAGANKSTSESAEDLNDKANRRHNTTRRSERLANMGEPMGDTSQSDQVPPKKPKTEESKPANNFLCSTTAPSQPTVLPGLSAASYLQGLGFPPYPTLFEPGTNNPFLHSAFGFQAASDQSHKAQQDSFIKSLSGGSGVSSTSSSILSVNNLRMTNGQSHKSEGESQPETPQASLTVANLTVEEFTSLKSLVIGYREAAALLLKSAEEIENLLETSGRK